MPPPKASKPWWPSRTVRDNPDDPSDLSGRPASPPKSYEEHLLNEAGGDDKGLVKPDPHGDSAPQFRAISPPDDDAPQPRQRPFTNIYGTRHHNQPEDDTL